MKFILLSTFLFLSCYKPQNILTGSYTCKQDLIESYGLTGYSSSSKQEISMCPQVNQSCCDPKAQLQIYKQWIFASEEVKIRQTLDFMEEVYSQIILIAKKYGQIARKYEEDFGEAQLTDCHVITKKMLEFEIEKVTNLLQDELKNAILFMKQSVGGFYCAICNGKYQEYFDFEFKTIQYSHQFCRSMIAKMLKFKLYFEANLIPFLNLGTRVLYTCNTQGQFVIDGVPQNVHLHDDVQESRKLQKCFITRNQKYYLKYCKFLCEEFKPTVINEKLFPHVLKYSSFIINVHRRLKFLEQEEIGLLKKEGDKIDLQKEDSFWSLPAFYESMLEVNQILKNVKIYQNLGAINLENFKGHINLKAKEDEGVNPNFTGINSQMTEVIYKQKVFEYEINNMGLMKNIDINKLFAGLLIMYLFNQFVFKKFYHFDSQKIILYIFRQQLFFVILNRLDFYINKFVPIVQKQKYLYFFTTLKKIQFTY